jgi:two-component system chemotaxis response regulator CheY
MKVLVLNNDLMERTVIQQVLQRNGHEIVVASGSEEAMQLLRGGGIRFLIADRAGTDIDAKQFIRRVREADPPYYIYILLITPRVQDTDVTSPRMGPDDYLTKPIVPAELKSRVQIGERILHLSDNLVQAKDSLDNAAVVDALTTALNQKAFFTLSHGELERARRAQTALSLIALDIDNFKAINQGHGEGIGNDVLTVIAQGIREKSRPYDGLGRYEDDMFLLILPGVIGQDAEKIAERILNGIRNTSISLLDGTEVKVSVTAGIVAYGRITAATEIDALIGRAKEAVSIAKHAGGNQVHIIYV